MRNHIKLIVISLSILIFTMMTVENAYAVKYPNSIKWKAGGKTFVYSLYIGVFGRVAKAADETHVINMAKTISGSKSKWKLFSAFVNSKEYEQRGLDRAAKDHYVFFRAERGNRYSYTAGRRLPNGYSSLSNSPGPYNYGTAWAIVYYYRSFY